MVIELKNISKKVRGKIILDNISLKLDKHIYGLVGPNGSGKTTLIRVMTNLIKVSDGNIIYNNKMRIGYLPQDFGTFKDYTVYEQLKYFALLKKINKNEIDEEICRVLKLVNLTNEKGKKCKHLSGGMIRRLGIAQTLLGKPQIIILDEPTVGLDPEERNRFQNIIKSIHIDIPIVLSTHIIHDIYNLCTHIICLKEGKIIFNDTIESFINNVNNKVYLINESDLNDQMTIVDKEYNNQIRVIMNNEMENDIKYIKVKPTIEDAYLYVCNFK